MSKQTIITYDRDEERELFDTFFDSVSYVKGFDEVPEDPEPIPEDMREETGMKSMERALAIASKGLPDTDPDPSPKPGARKLRHYWTRGEGAAKIAWGTPGDFNRCVKHLRKHVGAGAEGLCNVYHRSAVGAAPGKGHKSDNNSEFKGIDMAHPIFTRAQDLLDLIQQKEHMAKHGLVEFSGNLESKETLEAMLELKVRRVRTPAGAKRFGQPIGSIIVRDVNLPNIKIGEPKYDGWDFVTGANGKQYDVGKDDDGKWRAFGTDDWDDLVAEADSEDDLYVKLNDSSAKKGSKKAPAKETAKKKPAAKPKPKTDPKPLKERQIDELDKDQKEHYWNLRGRGESHSAALKLAKGNGIPKGKGGGSGKAPAGQGTLF